MLVTYFVAASAFSVAVFLEGPLGARGVTRRLCCVVIAVFGVVALLRRSFPGWPLLLLLCFLPSMHENCRCLVSSTE